MGGLQSGYARQFNLRDAFQVYFGGHLVSALKFNIPEARQILSDLENWLKSQGYLALQANPKETESQIHHIYIYTMPGGKFGYAIRNLYDNGPHNSGHTGLERYHLELLNVSCDPLIETGTLCARIVFVHSVYRHFIKCLYG